MSSKEVVDEIINDLKRIPKQIHSEINIKEIANEVSRVLQRKMGGRMS